MKRKCQPKCAVYMINELFHGPLLSMIQQIVSSSSSARSCIYSFCIHIILLRWNYEIKSGFRTNSTNEHSLFFLLMYIIFYEWKEIPSLLSQSYLCVYLLAQAHSNGSNSIQNNLSVINLGLYEKEMPLKITKPIVSGSSFMIILLDSTWHFCGISNGVHFYCFTDKMSFLPFWWFATYYVDPNGLIKQTEFGHKLGKPLFVYGQSSHFILLLNAVPSLILSIFGRLYLTLRRTWTEHVMVISEHCVGILCNCLRIDNTYIE